MRFLLILFLIYIAYKFLKPLLRKPTANPHVQGKEVHTSTTEKAAKNIEDAEFEEID
jgi:hypothetical protein